MFDILVKYNKETWQKINSHRFLYGRFSMEKNIAKPDDFFGGFDHRASGLESSKYEKEKMKKLIEGSLANFICEVNTRSSESLLAKVRFLFLWALWGKWVSSYV